VAAELDDRPWAGLAPAVESDDRRAHTTTPVAQAPEYGRARVMNCWFTRWRALIAQPRRAGP
jgi:hypothetical protein